MFSFETGSLSDYERGQAVWSVDSKDDLWPSSCCLPSPRSISMYHYTLRFQRWALASQAMSVQQILSWAISPTLKQVSTDSPPHFFWELPHWVFCLVSNCLVNVYFILKFLQFSLSHVANIVQFVGFLVMMLFEWWRGVDILGIEHITSIMLGKYSAPSPSWNALTPQMSLSYTYNFLYFVDWPQTPSVTKGDAEPLIPLPLSRPEGMCRHSWIMWCRGWNPGPCGGGAGSFPTGPHLQPHA